MSLTRYGKSWHTRQANLTLLHKEGTKMQPPVLPTDTDLSTEELKRLTNQMVDTILSLIERAPTRT